jgi:GNAT superfamily N-acetyltransferase
MEADDLEDVNHLFSLAFTDAYRRDGLPGMSVPPLHPDFLRLEWEVAGPGALSLVHDGRVRGFVLARVHGSEGWFGPLGVDPNLQGAGHGKALVERTISYLKRKGCTTIGLETMPRTYRNLGLYTRLGFKPGHLVLTVKADIPSSRILRSKTPEKATLLSDVPEDERPPLWDALRRFWGEISPGLDYRPEIDSTLRHDYGDVLVASEGDRVTGFVFFHHSPYFVSDGYGVLRVARLGAVRGRGTFETLMRSLAAFCQRTSMEEIYLRCQTSDWHVTKTVLQWGFRIVHSDLRMSLEGYREHSAADRIHISRWG